MKLEKAQIWCSRYDPAGYILQVISVKEKDDLVIYDVARRRHWKRLPAGLAEPKSLFLAPVRTHDSVANFLHYNKPVDFGPRRMKIGAIWEPRFDLSSDVRVFDFGSYFENDTNYRTMMVGYATLDTDRHILTSLSDFLWNYHYKDELFYRSI